MTDNPFKTTIPTESAITPDEVKAAGIRWRLLARIVDSVLVIGLLTVLNAILVGDSSYSPGERTGDGVVASVLWLAINAFFLVTRGQSIGKWLVGIQIADVYSNKLLGPLRIIFLREYLFLPLIVLSFWFQSASMVLGIATFIDLLCGLSHDRLCLHDLVAGSHVIFYDPKRTTTYGGDQLSPSRSIRMVRTHFETGWELTQIEKRISCLQDLVSNGERSQFAATKIKTLGMTPTDYLEKTLQAIKAFMENNPDDTSRKTAQKILDRVIELSGPLVQSDSEN